LGDCFEIQERTFDILNGGWEGPSLGYTTRKAGMESIGRKSSTPVQSINQTLLDILVMLGKKKIYCGCEYRLQLLAVLFHHHHEQDTQSRR
jgi:hypothetical protein